MTSSTPTRTIDVLGKPYRSETIDLTADDEGEVGSTVGMVAADALAIGVGALLGRKLPERAITIGATVAFVLFGLVLIVQGVRAVA